MKILSMNKEWFVPRLDPAKQILMQLHHACVASTFVSKPILISSDKIGLGKTLIWQRDITNKAQS